MQTWLVHMRSPRRLQRELGWRRFSAFQLLVGGTVLASLIHPIVLGVLAAHVLGGAPMIGDGGRLGAMLACLYAAALAGGYAASVVLGVAGLTRRRLRSSIWWLALVPIHWLLLAAAAWRAFFQLARDPYRWEKTAHGLARTSRLAETVRSPVRDPLTDSAAVRRRPLRAAA